MYYKKCFIAFLFFLSASCFNKKIETPHSLYFPQVKNIIQGNCVSCHQPGGQGMPLFFTSDDNIIANASRIKAAVADPVSPSNKRMPLGGSLTPSEIDAIVQWVAKGGKATD